MRAFVVVRRETVAHVCVRSSLFSLDSFREGGGGDKRCWSGCELYV